MVHVVYSEDIISNLQRCFKRCFKWSWRLQFIPAGHSCGLYLHGCVLPHMIKCYELWPCVARYMKTIKKSFRIAIVKIHTAHRNTWGDYTQENFILNRNLELKGCVITQIIFLLYITQLVKHCQLSCMPNIYLYYVSKTEISCQFMHSTVLLCLVENHLIE